VLGRQVSVMSIEDILKYVCVSQVMRRIIGKKKCECVGVYLPMYLLAYVYLCRLELKNYNIHVYQIPFPFISHSLYNIVDFIRDVFVN